MTSQLQFGVQQVGSLQANLFQALGKIKQRLPDLGTWSSHHLSKIWSKSLDSSSVLLSFMSLKLNS